MRCLPAVDFPALPSPFLVAILEMRLKNDECELINRPSCLDTVGGILFENHLTARSSRVSFFVCRGVPLLRGEAKGEEYFKSKGFILLCKLFSGIYL